MVSLETYKRRENKDAKRAGKTQCWSRTHLRHRCERNPCLNLQFIRCQGCTDHSYPLLQVCDPSLVLHAFCAHLRCAHLLFTPSHQLISFKLKPTGSQTGGQLSRLSFASALRQPEWPMHCLHENKCAQNMPDWHNQKRKKHDASLEITQNMQA